MAETDPTEWAEREAARLGSLRFGTGQGGQLSGSSAYAEVSGALEFLRRHAAGSAIEESARRALERQHALNVAQDVSRCLEQWTAMTRDGILTEAPYAVRARVDAATDLMEQVQRLLEDTEIHAAAPIVLAGAALEELLRSIVEAGPYLVTGRPGLNTYAAALQAASVLSRQAVKDVTAWAGLRNAAAHGEFAELTPEGARLMAAGVNLFMQKWTPTGAGSSPQALLRAR